LVGREAEYHPEATYYLRYLEAGKRVWQNVGPDSDAALVALRNAEHDQQALTLGRSLPPSAAPVSAENQQPDAPLTLESARDAYLAEVKRSRSAKTIAACEHMLKLFCEQYPGKLISQITRQNLLDHMALLRERGSGDRTIYNHVSRIGTFLKTYGVSGVLGEHDKPKYDEKDVEAYSSDDLSMVFAAASAEKRMLFEFFLGTGFREQEVTYATWANIDFKQKLVSVWSKPEWGFRVKDKEERTVPVPDTLISALLERKRHSKSLLIFPTGRGKPDGHMLRDLQKLAFKAGLNCGECIGKRGRTCAEHPICSRWGLHKFRKTFATMHSEAGVSAPTIQKWLGHADLATTLRYLAIADFRSERTRNQVNATFSSLGIGATA
jgi:integrase